MVILADKHYNSVRLMLTVFWVLHLNLVSLVLPELPVSLDLPDILVLRVRRVQLDLRVPQVRQVTLVLVDPQVQPDIQGHLVLRAQLVLLVT